MVHTSVVRVNGLGLTLRVTLQIILVFTLTLP
jgi:hypothetical protein